MTDQSDSSSLVASDTEITDSTDQKDMFLQVKRKHTESRKNYSVLKKHVKELELSNKKYENQLQVQHEEELNQKNEKYEKLRVEYENYKIEKNNEGMLEKEALEELESENERRAELNEKEGEECITELKEETKRLHNINQQSKIQQNKKLKELEFNNTKYQKEIQAQHDDEIFNLKEQYEILRVEYENYKIEKHNEDELQKEALEDLESENEKRVELNEKEGEEFISTLKEENKRLHNINQQSKIQSQKRLKELESNNAQYEKELQDSHKKELNHLKEQQESLRVKFENYKIEKDNEDTLQKASLEELEVENERRARSSENEGENLVSTLKEENKRLHSITQQLKNQSRKKCKELESSNAEFERELKVANEKELNHQKEQIEKLKIDYSILEKKHKE